MKIAFFVLTLASLAPANMAFANDGSANGATALDHDAYAQSRALSAAKSLCPDYFTNRYQAIGTEVKCSLQLDKPTAVDGWPDRWHIHGFATLRHYKDSSMDTGLAAREEAIRNNRNLSAKQINRQIESLYFIRSEIVEFEVDVSKLDSTPEIDVTIR